MRISMVGQALEILGITEFVLNSEPTTEDEFNANFKKVTSVAADGRAVISSDTSTFGVSWSQVAAAIADGGTVPMAELRRQRDAKLTIDVDPIVSNSLRWASLSEAKQNEWVAYRTALLNVPSTQTSASWDGETLSNLTWPTKPEAAD